METSSALSSELWLTNFKERMKQIFVASWVNQLFHRETQILS